MRLALVASAAIALACFSGSARAAESDFPKKYESKQWFALEFRFAPYWPNIDSQPGLSGNPYHTIFGNMPRLLFAAELDFQALRIPHFGSLGPGLSFGYTQMSAPAPIANMPGQVSSENTNLEVYPFYLVAVLRVDVLQRDFKVPIVPYAKAGIAVTIWRSFTDTGTSCITTGGNQSCAVGATWGEEFALGGMLNLDWIDRRATSNLDQATGINHTYLFGEWMFANLDNFGSSKGLRVGTNTFCGGLAFEF